MAVEMDGLQRKVQFCEVNYFHIMILFVDVNNDDHLDIDKMMTTLLTWPRMAVMCSGSELR